MIRIIGKLTIGSACSLKLLFLAVTCVGFVSCSETLSADGESKEESSSLLEELQKRFDFSGIDFENLDIAAVYDGDRYGENLRLFRFPNTTIIRGRLYDCAWVGVFENSTGRRLFEYRDSDRPISGSECVGELYGIYFDEDTCALIMQYPNEAPSSYRLDLIVLKEDHILRSVIDENALCAPSSDGVFNRLAQWTDGVLCSYYVNTLILYDIAKNEFVCKIAEFDSLYSSDAESLYWAAAHPDINNLLIARSDFLHCYSVAFYEYLYIREYRLYFAVGVLESDKQPRLFPKLEPFYDYEEPTYTIDYKVRNRDRVFVTIIRTVYCKPDKKTYRETKIVDVRLENDQLKAEIQ